MSQDDELAEVLKEFSQEAVEMLDTAESNLLALDEGQSFDDNYNSLFRVFHSLKGAAGMVGLMDLNAHMHQLENLFQKLKDHGKITKPEIDFFLAGVDAARKILSGQKIDFNYNISSQESAAIIHKTSQPSSTALTSPSPTISASNKEQKKINVMIIDDEEDIVGILKNFFDGSDFFPIGYTSPTMALKHFEEASPEIVFTDLSMPEMSGLDVLKEIRKLNKTIPVVFVSGHLSKEAVVESLYYGISAVIEKPFSYSQIISLSNEIYRKSQLEKILNKSIKSLLYLFPEIDNILSHQNKDDLRNFYKDTIKEIFKQYKELQGISLSQSGKETK